jgi:hypothetical protein
MCFLLWVREPGRGREAVVACSLLEFDVDCSLLLMLAACWIVARRRMLRARYFNFNQTNASDVPFAGPGEACS